METKEKEKTVEEIPEKKDVKARVEDSSTEQQFRMSRRNKTPSFAPEVDVTWLVLLSIASAVRLYKLSKPSAVVFDELHYGKFTSYFMQQKFFFDVHPPLGKLLFAGAGYLTGFDGTFRFSKIGEEIPESQLQSVLYLRLVTSIFSIFIVPLVYEIVLELAGNYWFAIFGALLVCFETSLVVHGRFVLLDVIVVFFVTASFCCYIKFLKEHTRPFSWSWWKYLICLGLSITGAISVKYAGVLSIGLFGAMICYELWLLMCDRAVNLKSVYAHMTARFACLFLLPLVLYLGQFFVMLSVLQKTGVHDNLMSSSFQKTLEGGLEAITKNQAQVVSFGSHVTLRNTHSKQCWLHSHNHLYPVKYDNGRGSSAQQQVTCYAFKDVNNWFIIKHPDSEKLKPDFPPRPVKNGDIIHIVHGLTGRGLNSHDVGAPMNPTLMEVSGYVNHNVSMDPQYGWRLEITNPDESGLWRAIGSQVRFVHVNTSASIKVSGSTLPKWGFDQFEVATDRRISTQESIWNVEEHNQNVTKPEGMSEGEAKQILSEHAEKQQIQGTTFKMSWFQKFIEYQKKMLTISTDGKEHAFASRPTHWPLALKGVAYWLDAKSNKQIFLVGNPIVYWLGVLSLLAYSGLLLLYLIRRKRACFDLTEVEWNSFSIGCYLIIGGYLINWVPYFPVERTLFAHHYLPALIFKIIAIPVLLSHIHSVWLKEIPVLQYAIKLVSAVVVVFTILCFKYLSPFIYGVTALSRSEIEQKQWLSSSKFLIHR